MPNFIRSLLHSTVNTSRTPSNATLSGPPPQKELCDAVTKKTKIDDILGTRQLTIDPEALKELLIWQKENSDNRLTTVLLRVSKALESEVFKAALKLIPRGSPVPVGAIVECVAAIVLIGIRTRERKKEALEFAMRVVGDIDALTNALGESSPNEDHLWDQCKDDLQPFCDAANGVCQWALGQLRSRVALSTDDLVVLEKKMENASASFGRLSIVRMLRALSSQSQDTSRILQFIERRIQLDRIQRDLSVQTAETYRYSEQGKQDCHPGTRDVVLGMLDKWLWEHSTATGHYLNRFWWITGTAGVGKTAIAISTIHHLLDRKRLAPHPDPDVGHSHPPILAAQYFFNHKLDSAQLSRLFPTLALQLAQASPVAACILQKALTDKPSIVNRFGLEQAEKLFLAPLCELCNLYPQQSIVIVIDGLDELDPLSDEDKEHCYGLVTKVLVQLAERLPRNAGLVILSRPETEFMDNIPSHVHRYHLDTKAVESHHAVQKYFTDELSNISRDSDFPSRSQLDALCVAADGHLGWAKGARSWLRSFLKISADPSVRDQAIVDLAGLAPGDLPALYCHMLADLLRRVHESQQSEYSKNLHTVLGVLVVLRSPQQIGTICGIVQFNAREYLHGLSGVYADGTKPITDETVPQPHKSFYDFVVSDKLRRDLPALHVDIPTAHHNLASRCFEIMQSDLHFNMAHLPSLEEPSDEVRKYARSQIPEHVRYACTSFTQHIQSCQRPFGEEATQWVRSANFLFWLEAMVIYTSPKQYMGDNLKPAVEILHTLQNLYPIQTHIQHTIDFVTTFGARFKKNPLLIYLTALPFSPSSFHSSCLSRHITIKSRQDGWAKRRRYTPCAISPDGASLAILSKGRLSLFSVGSGRPLWERVAAGSLRDSSPFTFSEDGKTLFVTSIQDGISMVNVLPVDAESGDVGKEVVLEISSIISGDDKIYISHSPGRAYITLQIESHWGDYLYFYKATGGRLLMRWTIRDFAVRWLSEEHLLIFGPERVSVVKAKTQELVFELTDQPDGFRNVMSMAYYQDGGVLVAGLRGRIAVWKGLKQLEDGVDMRGTMLQPEYFPVGGSFVTICRFSPDGKHLALGPTNRTIELWSCTTWIRIATLYGLLDVINELTFRRNGKQLVSRSRDGTIQIWDISAIVEGREHGVEVEEGALAAGSWFKHGIQLGGFFLRGEQPEPFIVEYPFDLPEGVERLNWEIKDSNDEEERVQADSKEK